MSSVTSTSVPASASTSKPASAPPASAAAVPSKGFWPAGWWKLMETRVGILPVPVLVTLVAVLTAFIYTGKFPAAGKTPLDVCTMLAVLAVGGFVCAEVGKRLPFIKDIG